MSVDNVKAAIRGAQAQRPCEDVFDASVNPAGSPPRP